MPYITDSIEGNRQIFYEGAKRMSDVKLKDIAEHLNVSIVTVSNALSGKKGVSSSLRDAVIQTAEKLGYQASKYRDRKKEIRCGVVLSGDESDREASYERALYQQAVFALSKRGISVMLKILNEKSELRAKMMPEWGSAVDGLLLIGKVSGNEANQLFRIVKKPAVLLDFRNSDLPCDAVTPNHYLGIYRAAKYLLERGHEDIALAYGFGIDFIQESCFGFRRCMEEYGKAVKREWMMEIQAADGEDGNFSAAFPEKMPTAFVCAGFRTAYCLYEKLEQKGYKVPEDISVLVYDCANILDISGSALFRQFAFCGPDIQMMAESSILRQVRTTATALTATAPGIIRLQRCVISNGW